MPERTMRVRVTIGDDPGWTFTAAEIDPDRWNGWVVPWFTEEEARKVAAASRADYDRDPEAVQEWVEFRPDAPPSERFQLVIPDGRYCENARLTDGGWLYSIGGANWTWEPALVCGVCGGDLEWSEQYPDAGFLHASDADDTHIPTIPEEVK